MEEEKHSIPNFGYLEELVTKEDFKREKRLNHIAGKLFAGTGIGGLSTMAMSLLGLGAYYSGLLNLTDSQETILSLCAYASLIPAGLGFLGYTLSKIEDKNIELYQRRKEK